MMYCLKTLQDKIVLFSVKELMFSFKSEIKYCKKNSKIVYQFLVVMNENLLISTFGLFQDEQKKGFDIRSEHIIIILTLGCGLLGGMCFAMCFNCIKKLIRDGQQIQVNIRINYMFKVFVSKYSNN